MVVVQKSFSAKPLPCSWCQKAREGSSGIPWNDPEPLQICAELKGCIEQHLFYTTGFRLSLPEQHPLPFARQMAAHGGVEMGMGKAGARAAPQKASDTCTHHLPLIQLFTLPCREKRV